MGTNTSRFLGSSEQPVEQVTWEQAMNFCSRLTSIESQQGRVPEGYAYRLPTEAEWEYAARAGTTTTFSFSDSIGDTNLNSHAWYLRNADFTTHPVERKLPNPRGIYDMSGNVAEWCLDWYGRYPFFNATDPSGPPDGDSHIIRGGSYYDDAEFCRNAFRLIDWTANQFYNVGLRVVLAKPISSR
jgi:formylglycine-generating enzyme required for sulfatase activity